MDNTIIRLTNNYYQLAQANSESCRRIATELLKAKTQANDYLRQRKVDSVYVDYNMYLADISYRNKEHQLLMAQNVFVLNVTAVLGYLCGLLEANNSNDSFVQGKLSGISNMINERTVKFANCSSIMLAVARIETGLLTSEKTERYTHFRSYLSSIKMAIQK